MDAIKQRVFGGGGGYAKVPTDPDSAQARDGMPRQASTRRPGGVSRLVLVLGVVLLATCLLALHRQQGRLQTALTAATDLDRLQRALQLTQESSRILVDKHQEESTVAQEQIHDRDQRIEELEGRMVELGDELDMLRCRAGLVALSTPPQVSLNEAQFTLTGVPNLPELSIVGSSESAPGINHILGQYKSDQYHVGSLRLNDGDVVIDVGAHIGCFSLAVAKRFPKARVIALEPLPSNFHFLKKNIQRLGVQNVEAVNKGLSPHGRPVRYWLNGGNTGGSNAFERHDNEYCVPTMSVDELFEKFVPSGAQVAVLNMDCEGCEFEVAQLIPMHRVKYLQMERHEHLDRFLSDEARAGMAKTGEVVSKAKHW